ncbi:unnamed protein product, partial [Ectocarpus sp. 12 AP-2014]
RTRNPVIVEKFACFIFCILQCHVDGCQGRSDYSIRHRSFLDRLLSASGGMVFTSGAHTYTVCHCMCFACPGNSRQWWDFGCFPCVCQSPIPVKLACVRTYRRLGRQRQVAAFGA